MQADEQKAPVIRVGMLQDFYINRSSLVKLQIGGKTVYSGCMAFMPEFFRDYAVRKVFCEPEIRRQDWREKGTAAPFNPEILPKYKFADLEMKLYYKILV